MTTRSRPRPGALPRSATRGSPWASCRTTRAWCSTTSSPSSTVPAFPPPRDEVLTSAVARRGAARAKARRGTRACVRRPRCGGSAPRRRHGRGARTARPNAVVVGFHRDFDYAGLERASRAIRGPVRASSRRTWTPRTRCRVADPGRRVDRGCGRHRHRADTGTSRESRRRRPSHSSGRVSARAGVMVGDRPSTDGVFAGRGRLAVRARALGRHPGGRPPPGGEAIPSPPPPSPDVGALAPELVAAMVHGSRVSCSGSGAPTARRRDGESGAGDTSRTRGPVVAAGRVVVGGCPTFTPARHVSAQEAIRLDADTPRFVSRGGEKLEAALDRFASSAARVRSTPGASTGGFTDCLLQRGAARVVAVDVGRGQLAWSLRTDARVTVLERTNVRRARAGGGSARRVAGGGRRPVVHLAAHRRAGARRCCDHDARPRALVKPQFEAGRAPSGQGRHRARSRRAPGRAARGRDGLAAPGLGGRTRCRRRCAAPTATSSSSSTADRRQGESGALERRRAARRLRRRDGRRAQERDGERSRRRARAAPGPPRARTCSPTRRRAAGRSTVIEVRVPGRRRRRARVARAVAVDAGPRPAGPRRGDLARRRRHDASAPSISCTRPGCRCSASTSASSGT